MRRKIVDRFSGTRKHSDEPSDLKHRQDPELSSVDDFISFANLVPRLMSNQMTFQNLHNIAGLFEGFHQTFVKEQDFLNARYARDIDHALRDAVAESVGETIARLEVIEESGQKPHLLHLIDSMQEQLGNVN